MLTASLCSSHRRTALLLTLAAVAFAGGCHRNRVATEPGAATGSAQAGSNPFPVVYEDWAKLGYRLDWVGFPFPGAARGTHINTVEAYDDALVIQQADSTLSLLESGSGKTRWSTQVAGPLTRFVGINRDETNANNILVSSQSEMFTVSAANGSLIDRDRFNRVVNTAPIISNGIAIFGCSTGEVMGHVIGRGVKAWGFLSTGAIEADPADMGSTVGFVSQTGDVMFFSKSGGLTGRGRIFEGLSNNPVADGGILFVAGRDRSVWAFDTAGNELWRHRTSTPLSAQPTAHNGALYVAIPGEGLTAFEGSNGKVLWNVPSIMGTVIGTNHGNLVVYGRERVTTLNAASGTIVAQADVPGVVRITTDKFDDGNLYAVSDRAIVAKFTVR